MIDNHPTLLQEENQNRKTALAQVLSLNCPNDSVVQLLVEKGATIFKNKNEMTLAEIRFLLKVVNPGRACHVFGEALKKTGNLFVKLLTLMKEAINQDEMDLRAKQERAAKIGVDALTPTEKNEIRDLITDLRNMRNIWTGLQSQSPYVIEGFDNLRNSYLLPPLGDLVFEYYFNIQDKTANQIEAH